MLVKQINIVDPQSLETILQRLTDVLGLTVDVHFTSGKVEADAKLGGQKDFTSASL